MEKSPDRSAYETCPLCSSSEISLYLEQIRDRKKSDKPRLSPTICWMSCGACQQVFDVGQFTTGALSILSETTNLDQIPGQNFEENRAIWFPTVEEVSRFR